MGMDPVVAYGDDAGTEGVDGGGVVGVGVGDSEDVVGTGIVGVGGGVGGGTDPMGDGPGGTVPVGAGPIVVTPASPGRPTTGGIAVLSVMAPLVCSLQVSFKYIPGNPTTQGEFALRP